MPKTQATGVAAGAAPSTEPAALSPALGVAVPLWIERLRTKPWDFIQQRAFECGQMIAEHGDEILYKSAKKGDTAKAFNALAEGLAALSFAPGGVKFAGMHWESKHADIST